MQQPHYQQFSIELDSEDRGREQELEYHRVRLIAKEERLSRHSCVWDRDVLHTFVSLIQRFQGLDCGWSAAATNAINDVQKSISTMDLGPSSFNQGQFKGCG